MTALDRGRPIDESRVMVPRTSETCETSDRGAPDLDLRQVPELRPLLLRRRRHQRRPPPVPARQRRRRGARAAERGAPRDRLQLGVDAERDGWDAGGRRERRGRARRVPRRGGAHVAVPRTSRVDEGIPTVVACRFRVWARPPRGGGRRGRRFGRGRRREGGRRVIMPPRGRARGRRGGPRERGLRYRRRRVRSAGGRSRSETETETVRGRRDRRRRRRRRRFARAPAFPPERGGFLLDAHPGLLEVRAAVPHGATLGIAAAGRAAQPARRRARFVRSRRDGFRMSVFGDERRRVPPETAAVPAPVAVPAAARVG